MNEPLVLNSGALSQSSTLSLLQLILNGVTLTDIVTSLGDPGSDAKLATEKAVRAAIAASLLDVAVFRDEKAADSQGGTFTSGAWRTRDINVLECPGGWCSLSSNQLTLMPGTYFLFSSCPAVSVRNHQTGLYNISASNFVAMGTIMYAYETSAGNCSSQVIALLSLSESQTFEIRHQGNLTCNNDGFGVRAVFGEKGVYTQGFILKL
jgi:hypothetical protein